MDICSRLWAAGIKAEFGFKPNPKMGDQLNYALEQGIPFLVLFGEDELAGGKVKVKDMGAKTEELVNLEEVVGDLQRRLGAVQQ
jgi:histidyl-tRNA synthetase